MWGWGDIGGETSSWSWGKETLMKVRASDVFTAYKHSLSATHSSTSSFDPETAHMLEELSEEYADDIHSLSSKLNTLGKMVKKDNSNAMALHLFDRTLM